MKQQPLQQAAFAVCALALGACAPMRVDIPNVLPPYASVVVVQPDAVIHEAPPHAIHLNAVRMSPVSAVRRASVSRSHSQPVKAPCRSKACAHR